MPNEKISQFTPSLGIDGTSIFAGVQTVGGVLTNVSYTAEQISESVQSTQFPLVVGFSAIKGRTLGLNPILTYLTTSKGIYRISFYGNVNNISGGETITFFLSFTDENGTVQTLSILGLS